jgi:hypothetical protein
MGRSKRRRRSRRKRKRSRKSRRRRRRSRRSRRRRRRRRKNRRRKQEEEEEHAFPDMAILFLPKHCAKHDHFDTPSTHMLNESSIRSEQGLSSAGAENEARQVQRGRRRTGGTRRRRKISVII